MVQPNNGISEGDRLGEGKGTKGKAENQGKGILGV